MRKKFSQFAPGTAAFVIQHASYKASRGRNPSQQFLTERNPRKALESARKIASVIESNAHVGKIMAKVGRFVLDSPTKPPYDQMSELEAQAAVRHIVASSSTEQEVQRRIKSELGCPHDIMTHVLRELSRIADEAKELCLAMGGVTLKTGELIQVMFGSPDGSRMISV